MKIQNGGEQMIEYDRLKKKWSDENVVFNNTVFYPKIIKPKCFCMQYSEWLIWEDGGGYSAPGFFDTFKDALALLRFRAMSFVLAGIAESEEYWKDVEFYLNQIEKSKRTKYQKFINKFDATLKDSNITLEKTTLLITKFNDLFSIQEPYVEIPVWGSIIDILKFKDNYEKLCDNKQIKRTTKEGFYKEHPDVYKKDIEENQLKKLIDTNTFNEENKAHMKAARNFLYQLRSEDIFPDDIFP